jgi:hypothetical protein
VGGAEPAGDGTPALGEQAAQEEDGEPPGVALVETGGQGGGQALPKEREERKIHGGSPGWGRGRVATPILAREPSPCQKVTKRLVIGANWLYSESADDFEGTDDTVRKCWTLSRGGGIDPYRFPMIFFLVVEGFQEWKCSVQHVCLVLPT